MRRLFSLLALLLLTSAIAQSVPEGIPRQLARQRAAQITDVRYELHFALDPKRTTAQGNEVLEFSLKQQPEQDLLLDYRDGVVDKLDVNGINELNVLSGGCVTGIHKWQCSDVTQNGHLRLAA